MATISFDHVQFWWAPFDQPSETYQRAVSMLSKSSTKEAPLSGSAMEGAAARNIAAGASRTRSVCPTGDLTSDLHAFWPAGRFDRFRASRARALLRLHCDVHEQSRDKPIKHRGVPQQ